ncbi:MAG: tetratricopeptide repeat protein, partial [Candidatus Coatesbacteria bacterium]
GRWCSGTSGSGSTYVTPTEVLGRRNDVIPMLLPHKERPEHFISRARYRSWIAEFLPNARLEFSDEQTGNAIVRRLLVDNRSRYCFAVSGLSVLYVSPDLLVPAGLALQAPGISCPVIRPLRNATILRRASCRSWFQVVTRSGANRTTLDYWSLAYLRAAAATPSIHGRLGLLRIRTRMAPDDASTWTALASALAEADMRDEAVHAFRRAIAIDTSSIEARVGLYRLLLARGDIAAVAVFLHETFAESPLRGTTASQAVVEDLVAGRVANATIVAGRAFAEAALERARRMPANPEYIPFRIALVYLASRLAPESDNARAACAEALQDAGRWDEAASFLSRLSQDATLDARLGVRQGAGLLADGRPADARRFLLSALSRDATNADGWFLLARTELALGNRESARRALTRLLALIPNAASTPAVRSMSDSL